MCDSESKECYRMWTFLKTKAVQKNVICRITASLEEPPKQGMKKNQKSSIKYLLPKPGLLVPAPLFFDFALFDFHSSGNWTIIWERWSFIGIFRRHLEPVQQQRFELVSCLVPFRLLKTEWKRLKLNPFNLSTSLQFYTKVRSWDVTYMAPLPK